MKIGLVRHFKVTIDPGKGLLSPRQFTEAMRNYDSAKVIPNQLVINQDEWDICYSSDLPRAVDTAEKIYKGKIIKTDLLIEIPISPFTGRNIKLPSFIWHIGARIAWYKSHKSQIENVQQTKERIEKIFRIITESNNENIVIVSHGFFMKSLFKQMRKKGFKGKIDLSPQNGKLYTLE